jgi:1-acyl-sn-glycerol-3-phosphate acyltransferase
MAKLYRIWVVFCFLGTFLALYPFFVIFSQRESWKKYGHACNKIWAHIVFWSCALKTKVEFRSRLEKNQPYVFCANHTSFMDIPSLCYGLPGYFMFIGKASLTKVPLFGYMFRKLYIPVNRHSSKSRAETIERSREAIEKGRGLGIFPEGTIPHQDVPQMIPFKDGAFRVAIEKQVPLIPVTIINNWLILPDNGKFMPARHLMHMVVHEPIATTGMNLNHIEELKNKTFSIIQQELNIHHPKAL